jgi:DNA-binding CsgD family transcriptional regulator
VAGPILLLLHVNHQAWRLGRPLLSAKTTGVKTLGGFRGELHLKEHVAVASRLVGALDATERQSLACLVCGMSVNDSAAFLGLPVEDAERHRASMMKKLNARRIADAVRIGLYAGVDLED